MASICSLEAQKREVERLIRRHGIPQHVRAWRPPTDPDVSLTDFVQSYHEHTFIRVRTAWRRALATPPQGWLPRPMPEILLDPRARVGTIRLAHFIMTGHAAAERRDTSSFVRLVTRTLQAWQAEEDGGLRGLILDFRRHHGGSMWPLARAFASLLGTGTPLYSWGNKRPEFSDRVWTVADPAAPQGVRWGRVCPNETQQQWPPIALIVGPGTYSSGEIGAAMFWGKPGVRSFGQSTGGGLSVNDEHTLKACGSDDGGSSLVLTQLLVTTSDGVFHADERLTPDVVTTQPVREARKWLAEQCRRIHQRARAKAD